MDASDRKILALLAADSRRALAEIGAAVGLSASAVNERIRRMTASGAIRAFSVDADPVACGASVLAFILLALGPDADESSFRDFVVGRQEIAECHHVTGSWSYLVKLRVATLADVETFLALLKSEGFLGRSETIISLSSPVNGPYCPPRVP